MGIELDILIGHPEHDILFIATQVARAAGLKNAKGSVNLARKYHKCGHPLETLVHKSCTSLPVDEQGRKLRSTTVLFTEAETYQMLLRGHAPASEPFRKWVTEEVLPSIRKSGAYNVNESTTKEGMQFAGELAALHDVIRALLREETSDIRVMLKELMERPAVVLPEAQQSPYEGTGMSSLSDGLLFDKPTYRTVGESVGLGRLAVDRLEDRVVLALRRSCRQPPNDGYMMPASVPLPVSQTSAERSPREPKSPGLAAT
ncbi:BRO-N domain-containing protein [Stutzerimonas nitrititolerans]|uniref:BRO-N domain-containing protein n=1 Tax=Stutzerimonas nitrititolerans TaxID=2482751 RepID=UPI0028B0C533|nr:BRO family protein [Stutzerimonas nitrititolerans]